MNNHEILGKYQTSQQKQTGSDDDEDELFAMLEDDESSGFNAYRAERLQHLSQQMKQIQGQLDQGYGNLVECNTEAQLLETVKGSRLALVHLSNRQFRTCGIMHEHLEKVARKHVHTRVLEIQAVDAPFMTSRLAIKILPCVVGYRDGVETMRLNGFEQLGNSDQPNYQQLEQVLVRHRLIRAQDVGLRIGEPNPSVHS